MALYRFRCGSCKTEFQKLLIGVPKDAPCPKCGKKAKRNPGGVSTKTTETVDNGIMARRVERIQNATEIYSDRARADTKKHKREIAITSGKVMPGSE
jgi:DNA-directed RNA polymerase subunit RPC12/RpoP